MDSVETARRSTNWADFEQTIRASLRSVLEGAPDLTGTDLTEVVEETVDLAREHWDVVEGLALRRHWFYRTAATLLEARGHSA